jgi:hypothetical protein
MASALIAQHNCRPWPFPLAADPSIPRAAIGEQRVEFNPIDARCSRRCVVDDRLARPRCKSIAGCRILQNVLQRDGLTKTF